MTFCDLLMVRLAFFSMFAQTPHSVVCSAYVPSLSVFSLQVAINDQRQCGWSCVGGANSLVLIVTL
jgi:hypothetical protein